MLTEPEPEQAKQLLSYLPRRPDYRTWLCAISAIANTFPENVALDILKGHFQDERANETIFKVNKRLKNVSFASLVYLAKQHGYNPEQTHTNRPYRAFSSKPLSFYRRQNKRVAFDSEPQLFYRFDDYEPEERAAILEADARLPRLESERLVSLEFPDASKQRLYRIAVNRTVINKNCNPVGGQPYKDYKALTEGFQNEIQSIRELADCVGRGYAVAACHFAADSEGKTYRAGKNFAGSDCFFVDVDGGLRLERAFELPEMRRAALVYTTCSHSESLHRYRIFFPLPRAIKQQEQFRSIVSKFIASFSGDVACTDATRGFFGNNNSTIFLIETGEILQFNCKRK